MVVFLAALLLAPSIIGAFFESGREWVVTNLGWFFIAGVNIWLAFLVWIACSRHGHIILGKTDTKPDFDNLSWFTMLFAGGIDYPVVTFTPPNRTKSLDINGICGKIDIIYWLVPKEGHTNRFYVIKDFNALSRHDHTDKPA